MALDDEPIKYRWERQGEEALTEHDTLPMSAAVDNGLVFRSLPYARAILADRAFVLRRTYIAKEVITGMGVTA